MLTWLETISTGHQSSKPSKPSKTSKTVAFRLIHLEVQAGRKCSSQQGRSNELLQQAPIPIMCILGFTLSPLSPRKDIEATHLSIVLLGSSPSTEIHLFRFWSLGSTRSSSSSGEVSTELWNHLVSASTGISKQKLRNSYKTQQEGIEKVILWGSILCVAM